MTIKSVVLTSVMLVTVALAASAQKNQTIFGSGQPKKSGAYGAIANKFTRINGSFANINEVYGGWFVNRSLLIGASISATSNRIDVPEVNKLWDGGRMTYQYGQVGLMTEYVIGSTKKVHFAVNLVTGAGFMLQYDRYDLRDWDDHYVRNNNPSFFFVMEPGAQLELNLINWMRFSPGVSYRRTFGSDSKGLSDNDISGFAGNITFKFGRF